MWEVNVGGNPTNPVHVHAGIVPVHKNHADTEATLIPENHVDDRTVHVRAGMLIGVQIPREAASSQRSYGRYESCLTESHSVAVIRRNQTGPNAEQIYTSIV